MERHLAAFFLALGTCTALAHADSTVSGFLNINGPSISCNQSASATTSIDFSCTPTSITDWGYLRASASAISVYAWTEMQTGFTGKPETNAYGQSGFQLSMDGLYMLTGGTGFGLATWSLETENSVYGPGAWRCSVTLNGVTETCDTHQHSQTGSFYVPYNTPLQLNFTGWGELFSRGAMAAGPLSLSFGLTNLEPVPAAPTPEPTPAVLTGMGIVTLMAGTTLRRFRLATLRH